MGTIFALAIQYRKILIPIGVALAVLALLFGIYEKGRWAERRAQAEASAAAQAQADLRAAAATSAAASERAADEAQVGNTLNDHRELINGEPDSAPSAASVALNCRRLCDQGTDLAKVPPCARFAAACQATHKH